MAKLKRDLASLVRNWLRAARAEHVNLSVAYFTAASGRAPTALGIGSPLTGEVPLHGTKPLCTSM